MNENQFGVILESILDKVNGMIEGQQVMKEDFEKRFDSIGSDLKELKQDVRVLKQDNQIIKGHLAAIEDGLNDHEKRITTLENKVVI